MQKLQFLCPNHRDWLSNNPKIATNQWVISYSQCLDHIEERDYSQAVLHAGAAYETADILISQRLSPGDLHRFSDSATMLAQLLLRVGDVASARQVIGASVCCLERLLANGIDRRRILGACERLLRVGNQFPTDAGHRAKRPHAHVHKTATTRIH